MEANTNDEDNLREQSTNLAHESEVSGATPEAAANCLADRLKHDWYQTEAQVVLSVFLRNTKISNINVTISNRNVVCTGDLEDGTVYRLHLNLSQAIIPEASSWKQYTTKIEIKMKKLEGIRWLSLQGNESDQPSILMAPVPPQDNPIVTDEGLITTSKPAKKDWDKLAVEIQKEEADEIEGESALNQLFQKIYSEGSDDVKKAMNKSFMESGGTVLSTNWNDIAAKKVEINPPDGMEFKSWEK